MKDFFRVYNLRSKDLDTKGFPKLPDVDKLAYGEIAINYKDGQEIFTIKNSKNELVTFESTNYDMFINVDRRYKLDSGYHTHDTAIKSIQPKDRRIGLVLFYKTSDNTYVFEQFVGTNLDDWLFPQNWKPINGIIDNLTSHSALESLSANQGRILNEKFIFLDHTLLPAEMFTWVSPDGYSERGKPIDVTYHWTVSRKGYTNVPILELYIDNQKVTPVNEKTYRISNSKTIKVKAVTTDNLYVEKYIQKKFTEVIYAGLVDAGFDINPTSIKQFEKKGYLTENKSYTSELGVVHDKVSFYAFPTSRGFITQVKDANNFDITGLYKTPDGKFRAKIIGMQIGGELVEYSVYTSEPFSTTESVTHKFI